jgi:hypothetical protein
MESRCDRPASSTSPTRSRSSNGSGDKWVEVLDKLLGGLILAGAASGHPQLLALIGPKNEAVKLSKEKLRDVEKHVAGLGSLSRSQRLEAAHTILVVVSYLTALDELVAKYGEKSGYLLSDLSSALALKPGTGEDPSGRTVDGLLKRVVPTPSATLTRHELRAAVRVFMRELGANVATTMQGLSLWDRLNETDQAALLESVRHELPEAALQQSEAEYRQLATKVPEFQIWSQLHDTEATQQQLADATDLIQEELRALVDRTDTGLEGLSEVLAAISSGQSPGQQHLRESLAAVYQAELEREVVATEGTGLEGLVSAPRTSDAYINHDYKVHKYSSPDSPSSEQWWEPKPRREDLQSFLASFLTTSECVNKPLLVLGHPGSGKSLLTKILAARLPQSLFTPIRVPLRTVDANAAVSRQIEQALRQTLNEDVAWRSLRAAAEDTVPVVLLDGLDELLQAAGVSRSDYLELVQEFQRTESELGGPTVVVVTSRTVVANRARIPQQTTVLKLEPFSDRQVGLWLDRWRMANTAIFDARGVASLSPEVALSQGELARQPILLLMLALYDADENALQTAGPHLSRAALYERLLQRFVTREVSREDPGLTIETMNRSIEDELRRLEIVALALFNPKRQDIQDRLLERDFESLYGPSALDSASEGNFRRHMGMAERMLGRFFFVHRAEVSDSSLETRDDLPLIGTRRRPR